MESVRAWRSSSYPQMNYLVTRADLVFQVSHWQYYQQRFQTSLSSDDDVILPKTLSVIFNFLVSDYSIAIDDDEYNNSGSLDTLLSSASCSTITGFIQSSKLPRCYGLGISGSTKKRWKWGHLTVLRSFLSTPQLGVIIISPPSQRYYDLKMILTNGFSQSNDVHQILPTTFSQNPLYQLCHSIFLLR